LRQAPFLSVERRDSRTGGRSELCDEKQQSVGEITEEHAA
jgi:hypothetical protein